MKFAANPSHAQTPSISSVPADWSGLTGAARSSRTAACVAAGAALNHRFSLFVEGTSASWAPLAGTLAGMSYAAKDMFDLPGRAPCFGLDAALSAPTSVAADILRRIDAAGGHRVGLTRMTALAYEPSGVNTARNPWNPDMAPGGSSSGSAAAVASGAAFVALGSDTAGSLRIPAHCCGVTAWKPSPGVVPIDGAMALAPSLDTVGLLARSARDIALVKSAAGLGPARRDLAGTWAAPAVAVASDLLAAAEPSVRAACADGLAVLEALGCAAADVVAGPLVKQAGDLTLRILQAEAARRYAGAAVQAASDAYLARRLKSGFAIDDATLSADLGARAALRRQFLEKAFAAASVLLLPVMPIRTPPLSEVDPASDGFVPRTLYALSAWTRFANGLGLPVVALPTGVDDRGMPVALQLVGRPGSDDALLDLGARFQAASDWHLRFPPLAADILMHVERG